MEETYKIVNEQTDYTNSNLATFLFENYNLLFKEEKVNYLHLIMNETNIDNILFEFILEN